LAYGVDGRLKSGDQKFALEMEFHWQIAVELDEQFILGHHFLLPTSTSIRGKLSLSRKHLLSFRQ
jgi:hypothetical protein